MPQKKVVNLVDTINTQTVGGSKTFSNPLAVSDTTLSTSSTTGSGKFSGGVGIAGAVTVGPNTGNGTAGDITGSRIYASNTAVFNSTTIDAGLAVTARTTGAKTILARALNSQTGNLFEIQDSSANPIWVMNASGNILVNGATDDGSSKLQVAGRGRFTGALNVTDTTASTNATTGALTVGGGVGVGGTVNVSNILNVSTVSFSGSDDGVGVSTLNLGRVGSGGNLINIGSNASGSNDTTLRLLRNSGATEYLQFIAPRGGSSGLNNLYSIDSVSGAAGGTRPIQFRILNTSASPVSYTPLYLANTGNVLINTTTDDNSGNALQVNGSAKVQGFTTAINTRTSAYTLTSTDSTIRGDATSAAFTLTLPSSATNTGRMYRIIKVDSSANAITINTTSSQTINGASTITLSSQWSSATLISDGTNWLRF
ncbi:hypothetical protein G7B40_001355 [Aetokthonos hydrillicola Thurmond2011]|jgi:hypothetical protein|uniref:Uncharacterized protein n=1 Tax=Aetokthonos hydrillicola Thurmond2011 TaxID=2712845 RepID=A0AAP5I3T3_9CYAN|nr:hypothetical protein [Aetokthonos hydrillicola]MBO3463821.1 hypothetical protein [Aetokthonos hydrillicola CCALA 1050]MDR9893232.1 hypothetical protein [Aetokthonos hydrillicola Thurmond2011]